MHTEKHILKHSFLLPRYLVLVHPSLLPVEKHCPWRNTNKAISYFLYHLQLHFISCSDSLFQFSQNSKWFPSWSMSFDIGKEKIEKWRKWNKIFISHFTKTLARQHWMLCLCVKILHRGNIATYLQYALGALHGCNNPPKEV